MFCPGFAADVPGEDKSSGRLCLYRRACREVDEHYIINASAQRAEGCAACHDGV
jgi:hypothetical protein